MPSGGRHEMNILTVNLILSTVIFAIVAKLYRVDESESANQGRLLALRL